MPRLSATDCFRPAFDRTKALLFQPFRFGFWLRLALLGLLTGELGSGGCNFSGNFPTDTHTTDRTQSFVSLDPVWERVAHYWWLIAIAAVVFFVIFIVFIYLGSVARFILLEAILDGRTSITEGWRRWRSAGVSYFQFQLAFFVIVWGALLILIGLPLFIAYHQGFFSNFSQHIFAGALLITALVGLALIIFLASAVIHVLAKDFVVPVMALDTLPFTAAWLRFASLLSQEKGGFAAYLGIKILLAIAASIAFGIGTLLLILVLLIPIAIVAAIVIAVGAASGLTWTPMTIALAVAIGINAVVGLIIIVLFLHTPLAAFFPSYSYYFFAGRFAPLHDRLYPPPPAPPVAAPPPPPGPGPDLPPEPALG